MLNKNPLVSVIIPNYNYANYISEAVNSVLKQTYSNLEVIVVDDGSTDNSLEVLKQFNNQISVISKLNGGVSSARNFGISASKGDFICFLDADDSWLESKIYEQLELALSTDLGLIYSGYFQCDSKLSPEREISPKYGGDCEGIYRKYPGSAVALLGTSTALIRKDIIKSVGLFDERLNTSADWDFLRRASKITDFGYTHDAQVMYRRHGSNMSAGSISHYYLDNERAILKMVNEYKSKTFGNLILNIRTLSRFYIGATKASIRSKQYVFAAKCMSKLLHNSIKVF